MSRQDEAQRRRVEARVDHLIHAYTEGGGEEWFVNWEELAIRELAFLTFTDPETGQESTQESYPQSRAELHAYILDEEDHGHLDYRPKQYEAVATVVVRCQRCRNRLDEFKLRRYGTIWSRRGNQVNDDDAPTMTYHCKCGRRDIRVRPARVREAIQERMYPRRWIGDNEEGAWYQPANETPGIINA